MTEQEPNLPEEAIRLARQGKEPYQVWVDLAKIFGSKTVVEYLKIKELLSPEASLENANRQSELGFGDREYL